MTPPLEILYEDNHCLAVNKPSGTLSTHFQGREETLDRLVKQYIKEKHKKPGNVFLGIVHRLDRAVSGVGVTVRTAALRYPPATARKALGLRGRPLPKRGSRSPRLRRHEKCQVLFWCATAARWVTRPSSAARRVPVHPATAVPACLRPDFVDKRALELRRPCVCRARARRVFFFPAPPCGRPESCPAQTASQPTISTDQD